MTQIPIKFLFLRSLLTAGCRLTAVTFVIVTAILLFSREAVAVIEPVEVLVIANSKVSESVELAEYYMVRRGIPAANLLKVKVSDKANCSRDDYNEDVAEPVRRWLRDHREGKGAIIRCLVTMYGMPLKVLPNVMTRGEKLRYAALQKRQKQISKAIKDPAVGVSEKQKLEVDFKEIGRELSQLGKQGELASLDSELALVDAGVYPLEGWQRNPSFIGYRGRSIDNMPEMAYIVARLDGPDPATVKRLIDDSIKAEKEGLHGSACFDARLPRPKAEKVSQLKDYAIYDNDIHVAAEKIGETKLLNVVVNDQPRLFKPGDCKDAALYCGWYRRADYFDAFDWQTGAIGYHIASSECMSLKKGTGWCLGMLKDGVAAVIGPVDEPYLQAFPPPSLFFPLLVDGRYSLGECFALSVPYRSWRMVLVGDPLYMPFKNNIIQVNQ